MPSGMQECGKGKCAATLTRHGSEALALNRKLVLVSNNASDLGSVGEATE